MTELRDVLHTALDIADATDFVPRGHFEKEDGKSLLCLLKDPTGEAEGDGDEDHGCACKDPNSWKGLGHDKIISTMLADRSSGATCDYALNPGAWRTFIDMEHSTCYNASNHWNALTDGRMKYIFRSPMGTGLPSTAL